MEGLKKFKLLFSMTGKILFRKKQTKYIFQHEIPILIYNI